VRHRRLSPKPRTSIVEVAARANVSIGTVSKALNHPEIVSVRTRRQVERAIKELGWVRNNSARELRAGRSQSIGLLVLDYDNPFFTEVAKGIEDVVRDAGYLVTLCNSNQEVGREDSYLRMLDEHRVRGVLITPVRDEVAPLRALRRHGITVVLLDHPSPVSDFCSVAVDDVHGGELAGAHLLSQGHSRIGFVRGATAVRQSTDRLVGLRRAISAAGRDAGTAVVDVPVPAQNAAEGEAAVEHILVQRLTAVFCANDVLALGILRGMSKRGASVPRDLAVVGYDDVRFAEMLSPALTSVRQPKYLLGKTAAGLLIDEAERRDHEHQQVTFRPDLVVRESSGPTRQSRRGHPAV